MIKDNQKYFNTLHVVIDGAIVAASYCAAYWLKFESPISGIAHYNNHLPMETYFQAIPFLVIGYLLIYRYCKLYTPKRGTKSGSEFLRILEANIIGMLVLLSVLFLIWQQHFSRSMIAYFGILNVSLTAIFRSMVRQFLRFLRLKGHNLKHVLIVGYSRATEKYIDRLRSNPQWGYWVHAILDDEVPIGSVYKGIQVTGKISELGDVLQSNSMDEIAIALPLEKYSELGKLVEQCEKSGVHTKFIPDYTGVFSSRPYIEDLGGLSVVNIRNVPLTNTFARFLKRTMDLVLSMIGAILISPLLLILTVAVKLSSPGPVIFKQERIGLHNKPFMMYKFRSMKLQTTEDEEKGWTVKDDPRVTKVGKFIRKTSLDELPQIFNVIRGDMSLVGPRPERPQFVEKFKEEIPRYMIKHQVRPGMTGLAQINGFRGDTSIWKRVEYDIEYIENWTIWLDVKILFLTFFKGFINKNAY